MARARLSITSATASSTRAISLASGRTPEAPLASSSRVSLVDVSPSTESGCSCARPRASAWRAARGRASCASVMTKPRVVAMRGWIMPDPLVMPAMRTGGAPQFDLGEGGLGHQVGGQDGVGDILKPVFG